MSLAARCPACRTAFRVVQDQLRISDGWVRCGRCGEVFNASATLFDLRALAAPASTPKAATAAAADPRWPPAVGATAFESRGSETSEGALAEQEPEQPTASSADIDGAERRADAALLDIDLALPPADDAATPDVDAAPEAARAAAVAADAASPEDREAPSRVAPAREPPAVGADAAVQSSAAYAATPGFVREAERAERWRSPEVRALLGGAAVLLAGTAMIQGLRGFHAPLTAEWPQARAWVEPLCRLAGCQVEPRRRLDALSVEGSSLVQLDGGALTRLSLVMRNRDRGELMLPAIELTLTDVRGGVVARKVFSAAELGAPATTIGGGAELALQGVLDTGSLPVVGYTIELFYP